eukprot:TRINITY_DN12078_c0_g1_i3.p1 TRINITY_DN12078_c0_g1~~TRINITY_DN12078_c0_g1_i3.p1  ORF type:complete len:477 (+),score=133.14 TRINITY_DN12078_c0_g1_i3:66-1496(+)
MCIRDRYQRRVHGDCSAKQKQPCNNRYITRASSRKMQDLSQPAPPPKRKSFVNSMPLKANFPPRDAAPEVAPAPDVVMTSSITRVGSGPYQNAVKGGPQTLNRAHDYTTPQYAPTSSINVVGGGQYQNAVKGGVYDPNVPQYALNSSINVVGGGQYQNAVKGGPDSVNRVYDPNVPQYPLTSSINVVGGGQYQNAVKGGPDSVNRVYDPNLPQYPLTSSINVAGSGPYQNAVRGGPQTINRAYDPNVPEYNATTVINRVGSGQYQNAVKGGPQTLNRAHDFNNYTPAPPVQAVPAGVVVIQPNSGYTGKRWGTQSTNTTTTNVTQTVSGNMAPPLSSSVTTITTTNSNTVGLNGAPPVTTGNTSNITWQSGRPATVNNGANVRTLAPTQVPNQVTINGMNVIGDDGWLCPVCGDVRNTGNNCTKCGMSKASSKLIFGKLSKEMGSAKIPDGVKKVTARPIGRNSIYSSNPPPNPSQ